MFWRRLVGRSATSVLVCVIFLTMQVSFIRFMLVFVTTYQASVCSLKVENDRLISKRLCSYLAANCSQDDQEICKRMITIRKLVAKILMLSCRQMKTMDTLTKGFEDKAKSLEHQVVKRQPRGGKRELHEISIRRKSNSLTRKSSAEQSNTGPANYAALLVKEKEIRPHSLKFGTWKALRNLRSYTVQRRNFKGRSQDRLMVSSKAEIKSGRQHNDYRLFLRNAVLGKSEEETRSDVYHDLGKRQPRGGKRGYGYDYFVFHSN